MTNTLKTYYASAQTLVDRIAKAERERDELAFDYQLLKSKVEMLESQLKRHEPASTYDGLGIEQWKNRATAAESDLSLLQLRHEAVSQASINRYKRIEELKARLAQIERVVNGK